MSMAFSQYVRVVACLTWCPASLTASGPAHPFATKRAIPAGRLIRPAFADGRALTIAQLQAMFPELPKSTIRNIVATDARPGAPDCRRLVRVGDTAAFRREVLP